MDQEFGVLIDSPKLGSKPKLLEIYDGKSKVYRTNDLLDAEEQARKQLGDFKDTDMVCSVVPLNGNSFGSPLKRYRFDGSWAREIK
ncbi:MAG: hypothetical protein JXC85_04150 [Candidatus Aenigmarchaeota archaeon]|nr:hypothetical protein [Candidatus Aenigmarchaeota archaeon]